MIFLSTPNKVEYKRPFFPKSALVTKGNDNTLYCDIDCIYTSEVAEVFKEGAIIEITGKHGGLFRVNNPIISGTRLKARCFSFFKDAENYMIRNLVLTNSTVTAALEALKGACGTECTLGLSTDFIDEVTVTCEISNSTLAEALVLLEKLTGGYLCTHKKEITLYKSLEKQISKELRYAENIKKFKKTENWSEVCTKIIPVGKDGILLDEYYLESDTQYDIPYTKKIEFEQEISADDFENQKSYENALKNDLKNLATVYLEQHSEPDITYEIEAYIDFDVDIGNTLPLIYPKLNVNQEIQVASLQWDGVSQSYKSIKFGKPLPTITGLYSKLTKK